VRGTPLPLMSASQREAYVRWLEAKAKGRRGSLADFFRRAARELRDQWSDA